MAGERGTKVFSFQGFDMRHYRATGQYVAAVGTLIDRATEAIANAAAKGEYDSAKPFSFEDYPNVRAHVQKAVTGLASNITAVVEAGSRREWLFACRKNDEFIASVMDTSQLGKERLQGMQDRNLDALQAFQKRKVDGMGLSQRVWKYAGQYKAQIELGLDVGLGEGRSAQQLSRDLRQNLNDPDRLFRRVRDKRGNLQLSKAAKAFHPGIGVYRSSAKNAARLARSEINMAYRESDWLRWQQLDFVTGFEVKRSNHEPRCKCKLCERLAGRYPKWFKFKGWHPQCLCYETAILMDEEDFDAQKLSDLKSALYGREYRKLAVKNVVADVPEGFKEWVAENAGKQAGWGSTPYFIRDNFKGGLLAKGLKVVAKQKHVKTEAEIAGIQSRWNARVANNKYNDVLLQYVNGSGAIGAYANAIKAKITNGLPINEIDKMAGKLNHKIEVKAQWDERVENNQLSVLLDDVAANKSKFGLEAMRKVYSAIESKFATWEHLSLEKQAEKLEYEIKWVEDNKKYDTWTVAQGAYKKRLAWVEYQILENEVDSLIGCAKLLKPKSNSKLAALLGAKAVSRDYVSRVRAEMDALAARRGKAVTGGLPDIPAGEAQRLLDGFGKGTAEEADGRLRGLSEAAWRALTQEERIALTKYTETYNYLNEPLRGLPYYGDKNPNAEHLRDLPVLTKALDKFRMPENTVVRRGTKDFDIPELGCRLKDVKAGDVFTDKAFLSTSVHRECGFSSPFNLIILVPKGARGFYAEPFSSFTDDGRFTYGGEGGKPVLWNGVSKEAIRTELEWIGQRGSRLKVLKRDGDTIYMQLEGQLR